MPGPHAHGADLSFLRDLPLARAAVDFASERHAGQVREGDGAEFILHPIEVAALLERSGYPDHVVAAAVLHDVLEDTDAERADLDSRFGPEVADLVALVSDDPSIEDEEDRKDDVRERVRRAGGFAPAVYAADKISKVRELRSLVHAGLERSQADAKFERHRRSLDMLEGAIPDSRLVEVLRFEIEALERLPPAIDGAPPADAG
jgi:(p)ppGpp synthase/HD superfamily hydrolase